MKITTIITKDEKTATRASIKDPCAYMECGEVKCEGCPFYGAAIRLRATQTEFLQILDTVMVEEK